MQQHAELYTTVGRPMMMVSDRNRDRVSNDELWNKCMKLLELESIVMKH